MRALERAYLRVLLDPSFEHALRDGSAMDAAQLTPGEAALLTGFSRESLDVERRARRIHLWNRARGELPRSLRRAETQLGPELRLELLEHVFCELLWQPERTLALRAFGQGYEMASHVCAAFARLFETYAAPELELLTALARLECAAFAAAFCDAAVRAEGTICIQSPYDLERATRDWHVPAYELRMSGDCSWEILADGRVCIR
ncbi:MAG TPA: hypothetical protein VK524_10200 [Polyangiaceae bacterium]|nr:hypothetical protein [Polyangiaceae bacterium]